MTTDTPIFNRHLLQRRKARAANALSDYQFLHDHTGRILLDRIHDIKRDFPRILKIGARDPGNFTSALKKRDGTNHVITMDITPNLLQGGHVCADEEMLPIKSRSLDMVISNLNLHSVSDLPGALIQIRHALKNDGLFIASMLGGETLRELRESFTHADIAIKDGMQPRIMPFADKPQMGDLLHRAGFALPVVDSDIITVTYESPFKLMHDLRGMAETSIISDQVKHFSRRDVFMEMAKYYHANFADPDGRIRASFEIIYMIGWAPDSSQQQPLKPGSADTRLADFLGTVEENL